MSGNPLTNVKLLKTTCIHRCHDNQHPKDLPNLPVMIRPSRATTIFKLSKLGRLGLSTSNFKKVYNETVKRRENHQLKRWCAATHGRLRRLESISRSFCSYADSGDNGMACFQP